MVTCHERAFLTAQEHVDASEAYVQPAGDSSEVEGELFHLHAEQDLLYQQLATYRNASYAQAISK